ncbi:Putative cytosolic protein [Giardia duodenalis]|uniref:Putative cytosolic protein n=1 Tax=Giardia intestinalis TaxID=5741 RepID=V6TAE6_GIAIN|nr:Putative cytosolic protein [Giardia intestinalis]
MLSLSFDDWATHEVQVNPLNPLSLQDPPTDRTRLASLSRSLMFGQELTDSRPPLAIRFHRSPLLHEKHALRGNLSWRGCISRLRIREQYLYAV